MRIQQRNQQKDKRSFFLLIFLFLFSLPLFSRVFKLFKVDDGFPLMENIVPRVFHVHSIQEIEQIAERFDLHGDEV